MLDVVQRVGFQGVELAQIPKYLYRGNFRRLRDELAKRGLDLLGLSGGSLQQRIDFIRRAGDPKPYLFCEAVGRAEKQAIEKGYRIVLHPHAFKEVHCMDDAVRLLDANPKMLLVLDSAHLHIVGDDILDAVRKCPGRLAAIHFKDWSPRYGRVSHRYAKGFTELGFGAVPIERLAEYLKMPEQKDLWGSLWAVYEQDYTQSTPERSLEWSAKWLRAKGFDLNPGRGAVENLPWPPDRKPSPGWKAEARLARAVGRAAAEGHLCFYLRLAQDLRDIYKAKLVAISARGPSYGSYSLLACCTKICCYLSGSQPDPLLKIDLVESVNETVDALERRTKEPSPLIDMAREAGATRCLSVPIPNGFTPPHIRFLVHVFAGGKNVPAVNQILKQINYPALAEHVGRGADVNLDDWCRMATAEVSIEDEESRSGRGRQCESAGRLYQRLRQIILDRTGEGACSIFRLDPATKRLVAVCAPGVKWFGAAESDQNLQSYPPDGDALTSQAWNKRLPQIIPDVEEYKRRHGWRPHSEEQIGEGEQKLKGRAVMFVPILAPSGDRLGVVRCVRNWRPFSDDDIAIVDAALQAAIPQLRLFDEARDKEEEYTQLRHELKGPIVAIANIFDTLCAEVDRLEKACGGELLPYPYVDDGLRWTELAITLIQQLKYNFHGTPPPRAKKPVKLHLLVAPIVRQLRGQFRKHHLPEKVDYQSLKGLPELFVDPMMFQEVFFNLIGNSIKYNDNHEDPFVLTISGETAKNGYRIHIRDNGKGVKDGAESYIFEKGRRSPQHAAEEGEGYGLWIVRRLVEAHGGGVNLTNARKPTEFTIWLPLWLAEHAPEAPQPGSETMEKLQ